MEEKRLLDLGHVVEASGVSKEWRTDQLVRAFTQLKNEIQAVEFFEEGRALIVFSTSMFAREALKHAMELPFKLKPLSEVDRGTLETLDLSLLPKPEMGKRADASVAGRLISGALNLKKAKPAARKEPQKKPAGLSGDAWDD